MAAPSRLRTRARTSLGGPRGTSRRFFMSMGEKPFGGRQVAEWIYTSAARRFSRL